jgi:hypothetical protein
MTINVKFTNTDNKISIFVWQGSKSQKVTQTAPASVHPIIENAVIKAVDAINLL